MKKISTAAVKQNRNFPEKKLTIDFDLFSCGSSPGSRPEDAAAAEELGRETPASHFRRAVTHFACVCRVHI
jgi:hypothetical protein